MQKLKRNMNQIGQAWINDHCPGGMMRPKWAYLYTGVFIQCPAWVLNGFGQIGKVSFKDFSYENKEKYILPYF